MVPPTSAMILVARPSESKKIFSVIRVGSVLFGSVVPFA